MLLEDNADLSFLLGRAFERSGEFELVGRAEDVGAAEALLSSVVPEVVVVDARLPGHSDLVLLPMVQRHCPDAVLVVLTALSSQRLTAEARAAGADFVVQKNKSPNQMVAQIETLLRN